MKAFLRLGRLLFGDSEAGTPPAAEPFPVTRSYVPPPPRKKHSILPGFGGQPYFPGHIELLQHHYDALGVGKDLPEGVGWFDNAARQVEGFPYLGRMDAAKTTGLLQWTTGYRFRLPSGGEAVILFPPKDNQGRSCWHCAVYVRDGSIANREVLERLVYAFICSYVGQ